MIVKVFLPFSSIDTFREQVKGWSMRNSYQKGSPKRDSMKEAGKYQSSLDPVKSHENEGIMMRSMQDINDFDRSSKYCRLEVIEEETKSNFLITS